MQTTLCAHRPLLAALVLLLASHPAAADPSPNELLAAYEKTLSALDHASYRSEIRVCYDGFALPAGTVIAESTWSEWRDGERWKFIVSKKGVYPSKQGIQKPQERTEERLYPGKGFIWVMPSPVPTQMFHVRAHLGELSADDKRLLLATSRGLHSGSLSGNGKLLLPDVFRQAKLTSKKVELDDKMVYLLEATGEWGSHSLWLDPHVNYLPRRMKQVKKANDWIEKDTTVASMEPIKNPYYPDVKVSHVSMVVDDIRIERIAGTDLLTGFKIRETYSFVDGQVVTFTDRLHVLDVKLKPNFSKENPFTITSPVANGTRVEVVDQPNVGYEWHDGKIVKLCGTAEGVCLTAQAPPPVTPLRQAHAHNDYEHPRPLLDALDQGFCSVEADIWLVDGQLLVAHERRDLRPEKTLEKLYLDPLRARSKTNGGRVYVGGPVFHLLIDVKSEAKATYAALDKVLAPYADILSTTREGQFEPKAVTVVVSGNCDRAAITAQQVRFAGIDGRPPDLETVSPAHLIPWISANWPLVFRWRGEGPMPEAERVKLREYVAKAHKQGRLVRFWATPEKIEVWRELHAAGVDLLNTDKLADLRRFLLDTDPTLNRP